jgi:plasminogen activator inhibitor 1 RNA-binding protein
VDVPVEEGTTVKKEEEEEDKEMTLEEYEKVMEEKRKTLETSKASERKVEVDKAFEKMQLVSNKKREEDIFIKLGQEKEKSKREAAERDEKSRKPVSINQFLKPAEGEKSYFPSNRGRGARGGRDDRRESGGRGDRESTRSNFSAGRGGGGRGSAAGGASAPKIEDQAQFPTLGAK